MLQTLQNQIKSKRLKAPPQITSFYCFFTKEKSHELSS
ncbi:putative extracellular protein [Streptococcus gallolyticus subsp. gallolyticus ATCC 43143]|nr:putative extracellular protein [Streptococcus gallolyticus subsp. gallolyticus ATCC 43143]